MTKEQETQQATPTSLSGIAQETNPFFRALPDHARSVYIHLSHQISHDCSLKRVLQVLETRYGPNHMLVTHAPAHSGQSFYSFDGRIEAEKKQRLSTPIADFCARASIDAVIYLCDFVCDGYQSPIFPEEVETRYHIGHAIRLAEQRQVPLIVGYKNPHCFGVRCPEREYITNPQKIKCPTTTIRI